MNTAKALLILAVLTGLMSRPAAACYLRYPFQTDFTKADPLNIELFQREEVMNAANCILKEQNDLWLVQYTEMTGKSKVLTAALNEWKSIAGRVAEAREQKRDTEKRLGEQIEVLNRLKGGYVVGILARVQRQPADSLNGLRNALSALNKDVIRDRLANELGNTAKSINIEGHASLSLELTRDYFYLFEVLQINSFVEPGFVRQAVRGEANVLILGDRFEFNAYPDFDEFFSHFEDVLPAKMEAVRDFNQKLAHQKSEMRRQLEDSVHELQERLFVIEADLATAQDKAVEFQSRIQHPDPGAVIELALARYDKEIKELEEKQPRMVIEANTMLLQGDATAAETKFKAVRNAFLIAMMKIRSPDRFQVFHFEHDHGNARAITAIIVLAKNLDLP
jgi:hypothetical protein